MKKTFCFLTALVLVLSLLAGCTTNLPTKPAPGPDETQTAAPSSPAETQPADTTAAPTAPPETTAPAGTEAPTAPPETAPPETEAPAELSAAEAYEKAVSNLPADYHLEMSREISRSMDRELLITKDEWVMDIKGAGTDEMTASVTWTLTIENNTYYYPEIEYQISYAGGQAVMTREGEVFLIKQTPEEFLSSFPPLALLTPDNYESIEWLDEAHTGIGFLEAVDTEWEWLGMDCTDISETDGTAVLDEAGNLSAFDYYTEYALEGISFTAQTEAKLSALEQDPVMPESGSEAAELNSILIVPVMDLAVCYTDMSNFMASYLGVTLSYAAGATQLKQEWLAIDEDDDGPMLYNHMYNTVYTSTTDTSEVELRHFAGKTKYTEDGEETEFNASPEDIREGFLTYMDDAWIHPADFSRAEISDEYDCWLIEFTVSDELADWLHREAEKDLFGDASYLSGMGVGFKLKECTGYLSVDKGSGMPIHLKVDLSGAHIYQRRNYAFQYEKEWNFRAADPDVWYLITEELRPSETPEVPATPLFYQVTAPNGHSLWLLGTIHVGDERTAHLPQEIYDALLSSDAIAVEIDVTNFEERLEEDDELMEAYQQSSYYADSTNCYDHLEDENDEKLELAVKKYGGDIRVKWLSYNVASVTSFLEQMILELGRLETYDRGVDNQLVRMAKDNGIEVWDVEDYAEHISLLGNFSEKLQELMLEELLDAGRYASNMGTDELFDAWCRGDEAELTAEEEEQEDEEDEELTPEEQALIDEYNEGMMLKRNAEMLAKTKEYLEGDKKVFFAVGLAHLLDDENGLLKCLREEGYTVEQVVFAP